MGLNLRGDGIEFMKCWLHGGGARRRRSRRSRRRRSRRSEE